MRPRATITRILAFLLALTTIIGGSGLASAQDSTGKFTATPLTPNTSNTNPGFDEKSGSGAAISNGMASVFIKSSKQSLATKLGPNFSLSSPEAVAYLAELNAELDALEARVKSKLGGTTVTHRFDIILGGLSVLVPADQLDQLKGIPGVELVVSDSIEQLETYRSATFIGSATIWNQLGGQGSAGEGVIAGILDSGVWPENPSFSDPDPLGKAYTAPPAAPGNPGGTRACNFGSATPGDAPFSCNNKLIGSYRFMSTYGAVVGLQPYEFRSSRDDDGHGTHTSTTVAGNRGVRAQTLNADDIITGVAPRAHIVSYKVCGEQGCFGTDSAAAVQQAIRDGVDTINFSISGGSNPYADVVSLAFLDAYNAGIFVAASAGNSGPTPETVNHREPWVMTVAASSSDRSYLSTATLTAPGGATLTITGASITDGVSTPAEVVVNSADTLCQNPAAAGSFTGKIVVCRRGVNARTAKSANVKAGGAVGMFLYNPTPQGENADSHSLPTVHFENNEGTQLLAFLAANPGATATFTGGVAGSIPGDIMAGFSSRGGPAQSLGISKPDVTAPGINIFAGYTAKEYGVDVDQFSFLSGTSMSGPHVAGAGTLLVALHPDWTPGQIKSALMTTAKTTGVLKEDAVTQATPFDMGSGRIDLRKAGDPGLTIAATGAEFLAKQANLWDANYPSIYIPTMPGQITVKRTFTDVLGYDNTWAIRVRAPRDVKITVPTQIFVRGNSSASIDIVIDARTVPIGEVRHASISLNDGHGTLSIPITIVRKEPSVALSTTCDAARIKIGQQMGCSITMTNNSFDTATVSMVDRIPYNIVRLSDSVVNGSLDGMNVVFNGTLAGVEPVDVDIVSDVGGSPAGGYLPLSIFGIGAISAGDETSTNFNVPTFTYGGETYNRIGVVSNGYVVLGGTDGSPDIQFINQSLPDSDRPNNVLAPFWTDLNPAFGGAIRVAILTDGVNSWIVVDYDAVREYSTNRRNSFQIWIGINGVEDVTFTYGTLEGNGDGGFVTVGAENRFGNRGTNYYVDGVGTLPTSGTELRVNTTPGGPGETRVVSFQVKGQEVGRWTNYVELSSDTFAGKNVVGFSGRTTR
jgi:hypothetical protein